MIRKFLTNLEDPDRPFLGPNYWILVKMGFLLPETKIKKIGYMFLHELVTLFVITQYMELFVISNDLDLVLTNLKISMLSIVCVVKTNTFALWQDRWRDIIEYVNESDKYERNHRDTVKGKILDSYTKYCRRVTYFYWCLVFSTFVTVTQTPLLRYFSSSTFREELQNGTELFPHIFSSWMPFDKYHSPGSWVTVIWHFFMCAYGACVMAAFDASIIVILVFFSGKLQLLRERSKQIFGSFEKDVSSQEVWKTVQQLHEAHVQLTKYSRMFNSCLSPVMFLYVVMCSLMLCASAFQLTSATTPTQKLLMAEYLIFGIAQLFGFCWHSNDVLEKSQYLLYGPYESKWWTANFRQKKSIMLLAGQFRNDYIFTAGPFTNLTLSTFLAILKGAYSYYTLLRK